MARNVPIWVVAAVLFSVIAVSGVSLPGATTSAVAQGMQAAGRETWRGATAEADWRSGGPFGGLAKALALSPDFASDGLAFAGGWRSGPSGVVGGYGIVRTTDGGATWAPLFASPPWTQLAVFDLAVSPGFSSDQMAFAATDTGLLRTRNRGDTWERLGGGLPTADQEGAGDEVRRVSLSPDFTTDGTLLAQMADGGLFLSTDRGEAWTRLAVSQTLVAAFSRNFSVNGVLYAVAVMGDPATAVLARSTDRGATWAVVQPLALSPIRDLVELADGALLIATENGVARLAVAGSAYAPEPVTPNISGIVHRLAVAGDHLYAAGQNGLFITLSEGRGWQRYADTPATAFLAVATCPQWSLCHALMASSYEGVLGTPDDNLTPWRWLGGLRRLATKAIAASPAYASDGTLFAATEQGLFRSTDRGLSWQLVAPGEQPENDAVFSQVRVSASYAVDGAVFATYEDRAAGRRSLLISADRGATWSAVVSPFTPGLSMLLAVSPAYHTDRTIFVVQGDTLHKTTDGGATWHSFALAPSGEYFTPLRLEVSAAYAADRTLFVSGWGGVRRSTDGGETWSDLHAAAPAYGLAISPAYATDRTVWHTFRAIESAGDGSPDSAVRRSTDAGASWQWATAGLPGRYEPFPVPLAVSPLFATDRTLFTALKGPLAAGLDHVLYRSLNGAAAWQALGPAPGNPDPADLAVSADALGRLTAHLATDAGVWHYDPGCEDRVVNGGFEESFAWVLPDTPYPAAYSADQAHAGARSLRTGIAAGADIYSYSTGSQIVTIPAGVVQARLDFWWYPLSAEPPATVAQSGPPLELLRALAGGSLPQQVQAGDWQYVLIYDAADGSLLAPRLWTRSNARAWQSGQLDLTSYRGRTLQIVFGTYNDGDGRSTAMYVDDVALTACWPALATPTPPATATVTPPATPSAPPTATVTPIGTIELRYHFYLPGLIAAEEPTPTPSSTPTPTATATATATPTPSGTPSPTATPTATVTQSITPTATTPPTATPSSTPSPTATATATATQSATPTATTTPTVTPTATPSGTPLVLEPRWLRSLVAAPGATGRLLGVTNEGYLMSSADRGETWTTVSLPAEVVGIPLSYRGFVGLDYNNPQTIYLGAVAQGLWRSSDGGGVWVKRHPYPIGPLAVSFDNPDHLIAGLIGSNELNARIARSDDGGLTWTAADSGSTGEAVSPILIDPQVHNLHYVITQGPRGGATLYRAFDGNWEAIPNAPLGLPPSGGPGLGLMLDGGLHGLYVASADGVLSLSTNAHVFNLADIAWTPVYTFPYGLLPIPLAVGGGPAGSALYVTVYDWGTGRGRTLRSDDGGHTWLPLTLPAPTITPTPTATPTVTATPTPTATPTVTPTPTATATLPPALACYEAVVNGGFETDAGWEIRSNPVLAEYVTTPVHSGSRSMRTGIAAGGANVASYSPIEQHFTFPALPFPGVSSTIQLSFWRYNVYEEGIAGAMVSPLLDERDLPQTEAELLNAPLAGDFFYVIAILDNGAIDWLLYEQVQSPVWRHAVGLDLSRYAGQHIRLQFGTYNDGVGGVSRTFVDDVSIQVCPPAGAFVLPAGWPRRVIGRPESATIYADVNGRLYRSTDAGRNWTLAGTARPEHTILSADSNVLYAGDGYPCYMGGDPTPLWRTIDGGATWHLLPAGQNLKPLAAHGSDQRLYAAGCDGPYLSTDAGASFARQGDPLFGLYDVNSIAPVEPAWREVWIGGVSEGGGGGVLVSRDSGASWALSYPGPGVADIGWPGRVTLDRYRSGYVYAPAYYGFFYTPDGGESWINNSQGLEEVIGGVRPSGLYAVAQDPVELTHRLYLGTRRGLYARDGATAYWYKLAGQAFDALEVTDLLVLDGLPARLYATTPFGVFLYDLSAVPPAPATPTPTVTPTPTATPGEATVTPTPTPTSTASPTPTATPTTIYVPTAQPGVWPTPRAIATIALPAGSHPHGIALDATGNTAYVAFHGVEHSGRTLGIINTALLTLTAQITLSADATGPNGVAVLDAGGLVVVANRQTANASVVNPGPPAAVVGQIAAELEPDGVIVGGGYGYIANFGNDSVTVFDVTTRAFVRQLNVGHQPALFAADPMSSDVYLSLHGAHEVLRLRNGEVIGVYPGVAEPYGLAFDPTDGRLYVANRGAAHSVTVIDTVAGTIVGAIGLDREPFVTAVNGRTGHLYIACGDQVKVYRTLDWAPVTTIAVPPGAEEGIALDAAHNIVYVTSREGDAVTAIRDAAPPLVLFASNRDGAGELYRMLPDGREQIRLTFTADASQVSPVGSPDGRWIAYVRTDQDGWPHLWLMSRDGRQARQLTTGAWQDVTPNWSGDGTQLVFTSNRSGNFEIYTLRLADGLVTQLTAHPAEDRSPSWSWANGRIAFQSNRYGPNPEIFSMAADGSDVQRLTINPNGDRGPSWSADGQFIVFWGSRGEQTLYRMRANGLDVIPLVSYLLRPEGAAWGPGSVGNWIAFPGFRPGSGHSEIFRMTASGGEVVLLTFNEVNFDYSPGWLPGQ